MSEKVRDYILELDGSGVFVKVKANCLPIGKVLLDFVKHDQTKLTGNKIIEAIPIYLDIETDLPPLIHDLRSGVLAKAAARERNRASNCGEKYCKPIYQKLGGVSATKLSRSGKDRPDGKSLSRCLKITPGAKQPWVISAEYGPGNEAQNGLIVPAYNGAPEGIIRVGVSDDGMKCLYMALEQLYETWSTDIITTALSQIQTSV